MLCVSTVSDVVDCGGFIDSRVVVGGLESFPDRRVVCER
jgi:hypothetical protein